MNPFLQDTYEGIIDEAYKTKPQWMPMEKAITILIEDRVERGILNLTEAKVLYEHLEDTSE